MSRSLRNRVKGAHCVDFIAKQIETQRKFFPWRINVQNAATDGVFTWFPDRANPFESILGKKFSEFVQTYPGAHSKITRGIADRFPVRHPLQRRIDGCQDN